MTIQFACNCGQQLAAREEYAGQRVRCTSCGEIRIVPARGADLPPTLVPAALELIRFQCSCGQICQARPEHAGRNTRCPRCSTVLTIPAGAVTAEAPAPRPPAALQANEPFPQTGNRLAVDADEAFEDDRPLRRRAKKSKTWIWIAAVAAVLLVGGGLALWLVLRGGVSSDFDLVPRDAEGFLTIRVADLLDSPLGKKVTGKFERQLKELEKIEDQFGLTRKDIERATWVSIDFEHKVFWAIVHTSKAYDKDKVLSAIKKQEGEVTEKSFDGKTYYLARRGKGTFWFPSNRLLVAASSSEAMEKCLALPKKPRSGPLDDALEAASKKTNQFVAGVNLPPKLREEGRQQMKREAGGMLAAFTSLLEFNTAYVTVAVQEDIDWEVTLSFPDNQKAKAAKETMSSLVSAVKLFLLPVIEQAMKQKGLGKGNDLVAEIRKLFDKLEPRQSGATVTMSGQFGGKVLVDLIDEGLKKGMGAANIRGRVGGDAAARKKRMKDEG